MKESLNKINYSGELKFSAEQAKDIRKKFGVMSLGAHAAKNIKDINYALMDAIFIKQKSFSDRFKKITTASIDLTNKYASMTPVQIAELYKNEKNGTKTISDELVTILGTDAVIKLDEAVMSVVEDPEPELLGSYTLVLSVL